MGVIHNIYIYIIISPPGPPPPPSFLSLQISTVQYNTCYISQVTRCRPPESDCLLFFFFFCHLPPPPSLPAPPVTSTRAIRVLYITYVQILWLALGRKKGKLCAKLHQGGGIHTYITSVLTGFARRPIYVQYMYCMY